MAEFDLKIDKSKFTCKFGSYCFAKSSNIADQTLQPRAQEYRRRLSGMTRPLSGADIFKLPRTKGFYVSRKYDGEFAMLFFDGEHLLSINAGGTTRVGLPAFKEAETLLKKAKVKSCVLGAEIYLPDLPAKVLPIHYVVSILRTPKSKAELERLALAVFEVIEDEVAVVGLHGEHGMAFALVVAHHCDQQRLARPTGLHQHAALEQDIVLAVALAVVGVGPALDDAPVLHIGDRLD